MTDIKSAYDRTSYILVVEDDETLLKFFKIHLNKFFSKVIVVKNAKEALDTIKEKTIDLVVSDFKMPRMDGIQLLRKVKKSHPGIPFILVSGFLMDSEQEEICRTEADGYLKKPFQVDTFNNTILAGIARREQLTQLTEMIPDKKKVADLISGKIKISSIRNLKDTEKATLILNNLTQKINLAS